MIFALNETTVFENLKITATKIKKSMGSTYNKPDKNNVFVGVQFTIENISDENQNINSMLLFDAYVDWTKANLSISASIEFAIMADSDYRIIFIMIITAKKDIKT